MADADSMLEESSGVDQHSSADDADAEDECATGASNSSSKKRKQKKRRHTKGTDPSSEDSDLHEGSGTTEGSVNMVETAEQIAQLSVSSGAVASASNASGPEDITIKATAEASTSDEPLSAEAALAAANRTSTLQRLQEILISPSATPKNLEDAKKKTYHFWSTQPVPKLSEKAEDRNEAIEADKEDSEIRQDAYSLPPGFYWDTLDINDALLRKELYTLLNENYVEDDDNMFRFDYSPEFLLWALQPPGWRGDWHAGVRVQKNKKLVGFISAVPAHVAIYEKQKQLVEINFLCVHKKLRSKRMAPVLIKEITRRVHLQGIFQAVYTAGVVLPKPVASCRYWHRSLNPKKLIEVKFSHLSRNMTMQRTLKLYRLPDNPRVPGFREFRLADSADAHALMLGYMKRFSLSPIFTVDEFKHWFIPRPGIVDSYVVENDGKITDFVSFYTLPSTVMRHPAHKCIKAAYSFYNVATATPIKDLMQDALIVAKQMGFDVFNALDLMENKQFLEDLKFGVGDGNLQYYIYNWRCPNIEPQMMGLVLQ